MVSNVIENPSSSGDPMRTARFRILKNTQTVAEQTKAEEPTTQTKKDKKKGLAYAAFRGLGCASASASRVSAPELIVRSSSDWDRDACAEGAGSSAARRRKKKEEKSKKDQTARVASVTGGGASVDLWCSSRMAFASAADAECVAVPPTMRRREGSERIRREIMMFQSRMFLGGMDGYDHYRDWRLDIDDMSYEELLELEDSIGYVNTGLREEDIHCCLRKGKLKNFDALPLHFSSENDWKCSVCQEEYDMNDEIGKLDCGHSYHMFCIKQWLLQKNACPVCKAAVRC
ncbi:hypothetical protein QJS04_geneDACA003103 [Acorus gramineus]|uniref:RING-type E3 ubiquitin transferase n=1 Tax=Acorus gramineus TaxID=55184 RepID=A0AAV9BYE0_ACOGR|nr:hypothetical protein QJS04_geneDACA003103 [Acorus gramineus]